MRKKIIMGAIFSLFFTIILNAGDFNLLLKKVYKKEGKALFSLEFEISPGLDIKDLNKSIHIKTKDKVFSLTNIKKDKISLGQVKNVTIEGEIKITDSKGFNKKKITFVIDYELCEAFSSVCVVSDKEEVTVNFDFSQLQKKGFNVLSLVLLFLSGIATSFTPCVFPLIPLVFGFIGATGKNPKRALFLSSTMVLSMGIVYSALGVFAALSGKVFGSLTKSPGFLITAGAIMVLMGLSLMGYLPFKTPSFVSKEMKHYKGKGFLSAIAMGLFLGAIGAPCVGPVLISVLTYVSTTQNAVLGGLMLFSYSLGIGVIFVIIGTLSQTLGKTITQGRWMELLKNFFSILIIGGGVYFMGMGLKSNILLYIFLLFVGLWLIKESFNIEKVLLKTGFIILAILTIAVPSYKLYNIIHHHGNILLKKNVDWENDYNGAMKKAEKEKKIVFIDFYADWCENCHKLEESIEKIYPEAKDKIIFLRINMESNDKLKDKLVKKYNIIGLPGVVIECPKGNKIDSFFGFKDEKTLKEIINKAYTNSKRKCGG